MRSLKPFRRVPSAAALLLTGAFLPAVFAQEEPERALESQPAAAPAPILETTIITGKAENLLGEAPTASKGQSSAEELRERPFLRRGELLEVVPGMVVTQHSGGGKANQYFVRGFNLDHGTDFGIFVDGMPVNMRTHGHGQGYADINFLIPELVEQLDYFKGPYYADLGDFTTAGAARFRLYNELPQGIASFTFGENDYYRALLADSILAGEGILTFALEYNYYDGPWVSPDGLQRWNGFVRYVLGDELDYFSLTFMGYDATWDSTDQVPERLIKDGTIDRFGFVDPTVGGDSHRYSFSFDSQYQDGNGGTTRANAYVGTYELDLFSNFTLFLEDTVNGDQFNQYDSRWFAGGQVSHEFPVLDFFGRDAELLIGAQTHHDWIDGVALRKTSQRKTLSTVREDDVYEMNLSGFGQVEVFWTDWLRTQAGLRGDLYYFDVDSDLAANSGSKWDGIVSPKAGLVLGPWADTEFYLNGGLGFHSNDARGVTINVDPLTGEEVDDVPALVRTYGAETGMRTQILPNVTSTFALWYLYSDSELVYVGDAGNVEAGDASERYGIEWSTYWRPLDFVHVDTELTLTDAKFTTGEEIENAVPVTFSGGITLGRQTGPFATLRARYFSARPLTGDGKIESQDAFQLNARVGYRKERWEVALEALNLLDADDNDIEYYYASRLPGEAMGGIEDHHIHPMEPRQLRVSFTYHW